MSDQDLAVARQALMVLQETIIATPQEPAQKFISKRGDFSSSAFGYSFGGGPVGGFAVPKIPRLTSDLTDSPTQHRPDRDREGGMESLPGDAIRPDYDVVHGR